MKKITFYNSTNKQQFLDSLEDSQLKRLSITLFNYFANYERQKDKDLCKMAQTEVCDGINQMKFIRYDDYSTYCKAIGLYREFFGAKKISLPSESEYKTQFIASGKFDWVLSDRELLIESLERVANYSKTEKFDYSDYFAMPITLMLFFYYGLSIDQAVTVTKKQLEDNWTLPNGRKIKDKMIQDYIAALNRLNGYKISSGITKEYLEECSDYVIRLNPETLRRSFIKLTTSSSDILCLRKIREAGMFEVQFEKDIIDRNFRYSLSRHQIATDPDYQFGFKCDRAEIYNMYKAVRFHNNV